METSSSGFDKEFPFARPYGVLKTTHWLASLATLITLQVSPHWYSSVGFVVFTAWNLFVFSLVTWLCYLFGVQRKAFQFRHGYLFVPFALADFIVSLIGALCFGIGALICVISTIDTITGRYTRTGITITYLFATIFCLIAGAAYGYFAILIYRACPNGNLRNLTTMVIEGDRVSSMSLSSTGPGNAPMSYGGRPPV